MVSHFSANRSQRTVTSSTFSIYSFVTYALCSAFLAPSLFYGCHTHLFNGPFSGTTLVIRYQKSKTNLDFTEARDSEWQWHQLDYTQVCTLLQTDNDASTPPVCFLQAGCPSCCPTNSVKALDDMLVKSLCSDITEVSMLQTMQVVTLC